MSDNTSIEWTQATWNPVTGCDKVSPGCSHCYAESIAHRFAGTPAYPNGFRVTLRPERLDWPLRKRKPLRIFVNSMSDLFHDAVPDGYIARVWEVMAQCPQHTFQILTKRHARMRSWITRWHDTTGDENVKDRNGMPPLPRGPEAVRAVYSSPRAMLFADMLDSMGTPPEGAAYPLYDWMEGPRWFPHPLPNVWVGVSAENQQWADIRIPALLNTPAAVRFISAEPLLGPIVLEFENYYEPDHSNCSGLVSPAHEPACGREPGKHWGLDWVITGGESGPGARPAHPQWFRDIRDQCQAAGVAYLHKQNGEWIEDVTHYPAAPDLGIHEPYRTLNVPRDAKDRKRCALHLAGMTALTPDNPFNPFTSGHGGWTVMRRVGKKAAGRELDGRTWDQYPGGH